MQKQTPWTHFHDMHSGGGQKLDWPHVFIQAPEAEAVIIFQNRFGRNPHRVTCTCCGPDYSVSESDTLEQATGFHRNCDWLYFMPDGTTVDEEGWYKLSLEHRKQAKGKYVESVRTRFCSGNYIPLDKYIEVSGCLFIHEHEIKPEEREGTLRAEGYVWAD